MGALDSRWLNESSKTVLTHLFAIMPPERTIEVTRTVKVPRANQWIDIGNGEVQCCHRWESGQGNMVEWGQHNRSEPQMNANQRE